MPAAAKELSALAVKKLKHPTGTGGPHMKQVGGVPGLILQITANESKSWLLRTTIAGKRRTIGLGSYSYVSLSEARELARKMLYQIKVEGIDPIAERKAQRAEAAAVVTFSEAVQGYIDDGKLEELSSDKHRKNWISTLENYAIPILGDLRLEDIDVHDILRVLNNDGLWESKTDTASRVRQRIEKVLAWATVKGYRKGDNPARWAGNLKEILPSPNKIAKAANYDALQVDDAPRWLVALRKRNGMGARALEFMALTAARSGEVRGATWDELDLDAGVWTISAERMKMKREHRVPLSAPALALLRELPRLSEYVFPAPRGGQMSDMTTGKMMRTLHEADDKGFVDGRTKGRAVPHGLRSTFKDWAVERTAFPNDMSEIALAHNVGNAVEQAYRRADMLEKRREMMDAWAAHLEGRELATGDNVVSLNVG